MTAIQYQLDLYPCSTHGWEALDKLYGGFSETFCPGSAPSEFHSDRPDYHSEMQRIGGYGFQGTPAAISTPSLPSVITTLNVRKTPYCDATLLGDAVAVHVRAISRLLPPHSSDTLAPRRAIGIDERQIILLHQENEDHDIEWYYDRQQENEFWHNISLLGNVVLVTPGFSVYTDQTQCRYTQLYNLKRNLVCFLKARARGISSVLSVAWAIERDVERWAEWLRSVGNAVDCLALNLQTGRNILCPNLQGIQMLEQLTGRRYRWILFGPSSKATYETVFRCIEPERTTCVTTRPFINAVKGILGKSRYKGPREVARLIPANHDWTIEQFENAKRELRV